MDNKLPTESEIIALHKKYAPSEKIFDAVYTHCLAVWRIAECLLTAKNITLNHELVKSGCLLHDIGTYSLIKSTDDISVGYVNRGIEGARILKEEGLPESICKVVARHIGHGLTKDYIEESFLPLPHQDLVPQTAEERLVSYATKLHSRSDKPSFNTVATYRDFLNNLDIQHASDDFESLVKEFGEPNLNLIAKEFEQKLV